MAISVAVAAFLAIYGRFFVAVFLWPFFVTEISGSSPYFRLSA